MAPARRTVLGGTAAATLALVVAGMGVTAAADGNGVGGGNGPGAGVHDRTQSSLPGHEPKGHGPKGHEPKGQGPEDHGPDGPVPGRVASWNLDGAAGRHEAREQAAEIAKYRPSVLGLQEGCAVQVAEIARRLKADHGLAYHVAYGTVSREHPKCGGEESGTGEARSGAYGQAVLSAAPLRDTASRVYREGGEEPRGYLAVTTRVGGRNLRVFDTQLAAEGHEVNVRTAQVDALEREARDYQRAVVLGDFNAPQNATEIAPMWNTFADADPHCGLQWDARCRKTARGKSDYVFLRRGAYRPSGLAVHRTPHSGHALVHADLRS